MEAPHQACRVRRMPAGVHLWKKRRGGGPSQGPHWVKLVRAPPWGPGPVPQEPSVSAPALRGSPIGLQPAPGPALRRSGSSQGKPQPRAGSTLPRDHPGCSHHQLTANPAMWAGSPLGSWWAQPSLSSPVCRTGPLLITAPPGCGCVSSCPVGHKVTSDLLKPSDARPRTVQHQSPSRMPSSPTCAGQASVHRAPSG